MSKNDMLGAIVGTLTGMDARYLGLVRDTANRLNSKEAEAWHLHLSGIFRQGLPKAETVTTEKFALLADLGTITVPPDYVHATRLASFAANNRAKFAYHNDNLTDANFPNPSRILKPGDRLHVRAFKQIVRGTTTSQERMAFLATQNTVHVGAQGASLAFEQKRDQLPKGFWYCSFDEKERLWTDADGDHGVPYVFALSGGGFDFGLGDFERDWYGYGALLCFCDLPESLGA